MSQLSLVRKIIIVIFLLALWVTPALAQEDGTLTVDESAVANVTANANLTIFPIPAIAVGSPIPVEVSLLNDAGKPLGNKVLRFIVGGEEVRRARTDENGHVVTSLGDEWAMGDYDLTVQFIGTEDYQATIAVTQFTVRPIKLDIELVPPLPDIRFSIDGQVYISDETGWVHAEFNAPGTYNIEVLLLPADENNVDTLVDFERWSDANFFPEREIVLTGDKELQAGFALSHKVNITFTGLDGNPVDVERISNLTLKTSTGAFYTFVDGKSRWFVANRIARRKLGLEVAPISFSVESVMVDGANVVNKYQQRFLVTPDATWDLTLLLYYARVRAVDALFGNSVGTGLNVTFPNERTESYEFDENGEVFFGPLARGLYILQVTGVGGMAPPTPAALSRDQDVTLKVLTNVDLGLGAVLGLIGALGLLFYGRPEILVAIVGAIPSVLVPEWISRRPKRRLVTPPPPLFEPDFMPAFTTESYTQFINEEEDDDPPLPRPSRLDNWRQRLPSLALPSLPQLRPTLLILVSFAFLCLVLVIASVFYLPQLQTADTDQTEVAETVALITKEVAPTPLVAQLFDEQPPDEIIFVAPDPMTFITYEVQYGDSLDSIADQYYGTTGAWEMIFQANRDILPDSSILEPGMILRIPAEQWEASEPPEPQFERSYPTAFVNHEVQVGDSLDDLAVQFYGEQSAWLTIFQANRDLLPDATVLEPGMNLRIPMVNHIAAH